MRTGDNYVDNYRYIEHVVRGAKEHCLPFEYIKLLEAVEFVADSDQKRHDKELSIYR